MFLAPAELVNDNLDEELYPSDMWRLEAIRLTKETLRKALGRSRLSPEEIETVLCEVEAAINSPPLTQSSGDAEEFLPLTPAHLLLVGARPPCQKGWDCKSRRPRVRSYNVEDGVDGQSWRTCGAAGAENTCFFYAPHTKLHHHPVQKCRSATLLSSRTTLHPQCCGN